MGLQFMLFQMRCTIAGLTCRLAVFDRSLQCVDILRHRPYGRVWPVGVSELSRAAGSNHASEIPVARAWAGEWRSSDQSFRYATKTAMPPGLTASRCAQFQTLACHITLPPSLAMSQE